MLSSSMITIVFRVINFAVFISLLSYGFRRYIYAALREQMAERDKKRSDLEEKKNSLRWLNHIWMSACILMNRCIKH